MKKLLDALVWISVGANLAFIATMQAMNGALTEGEAGLTASQLAVERSTFFSFQTTAFLMMIVIGGVSMFVSRQAKKQTDNG